MTENKIRIIVLLIGVVFSCTAPFLHMFHPKIHPDFAKFDLKLENNEISKEEYIILTNNLKNQEKIFGFKNKRKFWYAVGKPIAMLYFALLFIFISPYVEIDRIAKLVIRYSAILYLFISIYFLIWTFWYRADFPKLLYYLAIGIASIFGTFISILLINHKKTMLKNVHSLLNFIVIDVKNKYVSIEDKPQFVDDYTNEIEKLKR